MAGSSHVGRLPGRFGLDRYLLRQQYRLSNPTYRGLEHGYRLWLHRGGLQPRDKMALITS